MRMGRSKGFNIILGEQALLSGQPRYQRLHRRLTHYLARASLGDRQKHIRPVVAPRRNEFRRSEIPYILGG
jgi:hypothetical protein